MRQIVMLSGSPSKSSRVYATLQWLGEQFRRLGSSVRIIEIQDLPSEALVHADWNSSAIVHANQWVAAADLVIVGTPIYKASYTGLLKTYLDLLPVDALRGKVVLPIAIGGTMAHLLAIEYALKPVLSALGARRIEQGVYGLDSQITSNDSNQYELHPDLQTRLNQAVEQLVAQWQEESDFKTEWIREAAK